MAKRTLGRALAICLALGVAGPPAIAAPAAPKYGHDTEAGARFTHDGIALYYEIHGSGPPLLLIHGNGASIGSMAAQIAHFSKSHRVIAMDSRDHGQSGDSPVALTFEAMADDLAALLDHVHAGPAVVVGWSDGAIEALLLALRHPQSVTKVVAMAGNLDPAGLHPDLQPAFNAPLRENIAPRARRVELLGREQPHIATAALAGIQAPVLVMAGDHDLIADDHALLIYHSLPNAQLAIVPDATHFLPYDDPVRFNGIIDRFVATPFVRRDRLGDMIRSLEKAKAEMDAQK